MPLVIPVLQQEIAAAFKKQLLNKTSKPEESLESLSLDLATAIDKYIKTATITLNGSVLPGQAVITPNGPGSTTTQGIVTGTGNIS
jgi:hypothetical protein